MTLSLHVDAVGFAAPGLDHAAALAAHFDGETVAVPQSWSPAPAGLSRRQAIRLSEATRLAIMAAEQISTAVPADGAWVFASSVGEGATLDEILRALSETDVMIQPLRFQNAVHNAAQGQWSILARSEGPGTSVASYDDTVGAGLLKAAMQATLEKTVLGLVIFDAPLPEPLHEKRPFGCPMAAALALRAVTPSEPHAQLEITLIPDAGRNEPQLDICPHLLQSGNPVRFALPLMKELFRPTGYSVTFSLTGGSGLRVMVRGSGHAP